MPTKPKNLDKPRKIARPTVTRSIGTDGRPLATDLEIREGAAFLAMKAGKDPLSLAKWEDLMAEIYRMPGDVATTRCPACGVRLYARTQADACGNSKCTRYQKGRAM